MNKIKKTLRVSHPKVLHTSKLRHYGHSEVSFFLVIFTRPPGTSKLNNAKSQGTSSAPTPLSSRENCCGLRSLTVPSAVREPGRLTMQVLAAVTTGISSL